jgi:hypothetical protein
VENEKDVTLENEKSVTLGVRVRSELFTKMEEIYRKWYVDKSKQLRCLLEYFLSLPEDEQKAIIDFGMQRELSSNNDKRLSSNG